MNLDGHIVLNYLKNQLCTQVWFEYQPVHIHIHGHVNKCIQMYMQTCFEYQSVHTHIYIHSYTHTHTNT